MDSIVLSREGPSAFTQISTIFIDEYMPYANDTQLKVYLFLLRTLQCSQNTGISEMADRFDYTEKEVVRALDYWEKMGLLSLSRNVSGDITYVCLLTPGSGGRAYQATVEAGSVMEATLPLPGPGSLHQPPQVQNAPVQNPGPLVSMPQPADLSSAEVSVSAERVASFSREEETGEIIFFAEQYLGRRLSSTDIQSIIFIYDTLGFPADLIDYLIQYCVERDKRSMRYIETVGRKWASQGINTVAMAKTGSGAYDRNVYEILRSLGRNQNPTPIEASFVERWIGEYGFERSVIDIACGKAVLATESHRLEYVEKVLSDWYSRHIRTVEDVKYDEAAHQSSRMRRPKVQAPPKQKQYSQFPQQDYDFDAIENLVKNKG